MSETEIIIPQFTKICDKIQGAEGPVFDKDGKCYMVAPEVVDKDDRPAGQVLCIDLKEKEATVLCRPSVHNYGGIPAGCQCDKNGDTYIADMRLGILCMSPNGDYKQLAETDSSKRTMQGCNDCIFDYTGALWITAPAGEIAPSPYTRSMDEAFGSVYCLTPNKEVIRIDTGFRFPNGIAVVHDEGGKPMTLIVAETPTRTLWAYDIDGPGQVKRKRVWGKLPECPGLTTGPDGMDFDINGNLLVAHWGSGFIEVFAPVGGQPIKRIKCPFEKASNLHFHPNSSKVIVTEHCNHALWEFEWECQGMPLYCEK